MAWVSVVSATAVVWHQPSPAPPSEPQPACAVASLPAVLLVCLLAAAIECSHVEPSEPPHAAATWAVVSSAPTWVVARALPGRAGGGAGGVGGGGAAVVDRLPRVLVAQSAPAHSAATWALWSPVIPLVPE
jgi:hypothetical protein